MNSFKFLIVGLIFFSFSCKSTFIHSKIEYQNTNLNNTYVQDTIINNIVEPYKEVLDLKMNEVIAVSAIEMVKNKPESTLGNFLADATIVMSEIYTQKKIDLAIINYGGIRVSNLAKGEVSLGNVYEIMPFDNYLVILYIEGEKLQQVLDLIASKNGWPISGANFLIKDNKAQNILIQNSDLVEDKVYTLAISDYLANGGDNLSILREVKRENTNVLVRDMFIEYFKILHKKGVLLDSTLDNRIILSE